MAKSDLVTKQSVLDLLQELFCKYNVGFKPEGDIECWGFNADVPKSINDLPKDYDVDKVLQNIDEGQSLNIPHQGYCINKDIVKTMVCEGWIHNPEYTSPNQIKTDIDNAIYFMNRFNFCGRNCIERDCETCVRYNVKKLVIISLDFYRHIADIFTQLDCLIDKCNTVEEQQCYQTIKDLLQNLNNHSIDVSI